MRGLAALFLLLLWMPAAWASCPATPADCGSPTMNNLTLGGVFSPTEVLNVKSAQFAGGAKGDTKGYTDGTINASSSAFSSASATFTAADVGKSIILHGSGTSLAPQVGTITGFTSAHAVTVSFTSVNATPWSWVGSAAIVAAGSGYTNGDTLTAPGGTCVVQPSFTAVVVSTILTSLTLANPGQCATLPSGTISLAGGTGTLATATLGNAAQFGGYFSYGTDDTTAVQNAIVAAVTAGKCAYFPAGGYWLASQTTAISLQGACLAGDREASGFFPYSSMGSVILISNTSTAAFNAIGSTVVKYMSFYYPAQDGYTSTPTTYPALFETTTNGLPNKWFDHNQIINAYIPFHSTTGTGGWGRGFFTANLIYGISNVFYMQNGYPDVVEIEGGNYFGPGAGGTLPSAGPAYLQKYTLASGIFLNLDISGGSYVNADGLIMTGGIVQGYNKGIVLASGLMDVSNISNVNWDSVGTIFECDGTGHVVSTSITGGEVYSTNTNLPAGTQNTIYFNCGNNHNSDLTISGVHFSFSQGSVFYDVSGAIGHLTMSSNSILAFGRNTSGSGSYYAFAQQGGGAGEITFTGNTVYCHPIAGAVDDGLVITQGSGNVSVTGNSFNGCGWNVIIGGAGGLVNITGNSSSAEISGPVEDLTTGGSTTIVMQRDNSWTKAAAPRKPTLSSCGGGTPAVSASSDTFDGTITIGTGGVTSCELDYPVSFPGIPPRSIMLTGGTAGAGTLTITASTVAHFVFSTSAADMSSDVIYYHVVQ